MYIYIKLEKRFFIKSIALFMVLAALPNDGAAQEKNASASNPLLVLTYEAFTERPVIYQHEVSGVVTDEEGEPLPGATILVEDTTTGTTTDLNGEYQITVPSSDDVLLVSFVGYQELSVPVDGRNTIDVSLNPLVFAGEELVVVGYGEVRRRDLTGSVASVSTREISVAPTHNAMDAIKARVPGVDITRSSGQAGSGVNIRVRGNRSISGSNEPLYIIDGFQTGSMSDLNVNDIESIEVLKDASATAIYGSQGANGVIMITTKSGSRDVTRVSYNAEYGINGLTPFPAVRTGDDYIQLRREAGRTAGVWNSPTDDPVIFSEAGEMEAIQESRWVDWTDLLMRDGMQFNQTISVSGGTDRTRLYFSGGHFEEEGMIRNDNMTRYSGRFNIDHQVNSWLTAGILGQLTHYNRNRRSSPLSTAMTISPFGIPYAENGEINRNPIPANPSLISPLVDERDDHTAVDNEVATNIAFNAFVELTPLESLRIRSHFGTDFNKNRRGIYQHPESFPQRNTFQAYSQATQGQGLFFHWDNIITFDQDFGEHAFTLTGITNYMQSDSDWTFAAGVNQALPSQLFYNLGSTDSEGRSIESGFVGWNQISFAGRVDYNYRERYLLTLTNRFDGASRLAPGNKWASFPSAAFAWVISDESFMEGLHAVDMAKIRISYGVAGNAAIDPYGTRAAVESRTNLNFGGVPVTYYEFSTRAGNPELGWETTATRNLGIDLGLYNRMNLSVDVYEQETSDLLLLRNLPLSSGFQDMFVNIGSTQNRGLEIAMDTQNILQPRFSWSSTFTFTMNRERITGLVDGEDIIQAEDNSLLLGRPINSFYSYKKLGIWQEDEAEDAAQYTFGGTPFQPGDIKLEDVNGDFVIDADDRQFLGANVPDFVFGLNNSFRYRAFSLDVFAFVRWGQMINAEVLGRYNPGGEGNGPAFIDYWTPENPTNAYPRPNRGASLSNYVGYQSLTFVNGSFIKLQNVTLGFDLPVRFANTVGIDNLRIYATGNNLWTYSREPMLREYDPERGGAESYPLNRQVVVGINIDL